MTLPLAPTVIPAGFAAALAGLHAELARASRAGLALREVPAPTRLAPHAVAVGAEVQRDGNEVGSGRFVVLHDPAGQDGWAGQTRVVAFVTCEAECEMAADPALGEVGWSWLTESLEMQGAAHVAAGGTVTRTVSTRFGQLADPQDASDIEVRASWTAVPDDAGVPDLAAHLRAWCALLSATAGLPPPGITALPRG